MIVHIPSYIVKSCHPDSRFENKMIPEMKKKHETYIKENFIDVIYCLVDAYKKNREVPDKDNIKDLRPINGAYSGYSFNKVQFEDPRDGKKHTDEWERTNIDEEEDRLRVIRKMNKLIQDYNKFVKKHEDELGLDRIEEWKYYPRSEFPEWSLALYLSYPTIRGRGDEILPHRVIDNRFFYQKATLIPRDEFILRFNKTIYDWMMDMIGDNLNEQHLLHNPILEFQNWFMKNGIILNEAPSLFDGYKTDEDTGISELEILKNTDIAKTKKIKELIHQVKLGKEPYRARIDKMIEEGSLETWIDKNCRKKNKKMNWAEMGRQLGCDAQTAKRVIKETGLTYLFDDSKNTYLE